MDRGGSLFTTMKNPLKSAFLNILNDPTPTGGKKEEKYFLKRGFQWGFFKFFGNADFEGDFNVVKRDPPFPYKRSEPPLNLLLKVRSIIGMLK